MEHKLSLRKEAGRKHHKCASWADASLGWDHCAICVSVPFTCDHCVIHIHLYKVIHYLSLIMRVTQVRRHACMACCHVCNFTAADEDCMVRTILLMLEMKLPTKQHVLMKMSRKEVV
jgi:hypothetical protein